MSSEAIRPSSLDGIKRLAKSIKRERGIQYTLALNTAAQSAGFQNFRHARKVLTLSGTPQPAQPRHSVYLTSYWRDDESGTRGRETLPLILDTPWHDLITRAQLAHDRWLEDFEVEAPDHLVQRFRAHSQSRARRDLCAAARVFQFMEATKLRPSKSHSRAYPNGDSMLAIPGHDHSSVWYDPATKRYLFADEPYERAAESRADERAQWSERFGFPIVKPSWPGMYNPGGGARLYLTAHCKHGIPLAPVVAALDRLPTPIVEATWSGESGPVSPPFQSPGIAASPVPSRLPKPQREAGKRNTTAYSLVLSRARRPATPMPIEAHEKVGELLKSVLTDTHYRQGAYNRINSVRCELDNWIQCEYTNAELSHERFSSVYYHENGSSFLRKVSADERRQHIDSLASAKSVLAQYYPECPPLRAVLRKLDGAINSLQSWV